MGRLHCTQDPVPEAVGGDMQQLNQLGAQQFSALTEVLFHFLTEPKEVERFLAQLSEFATTNQISLGPLRSIVKSLLLVPNGALKKSLTADQVRADFITLGLSEEKATYFSEKWKQSAPTLARWAIGQTLMINQLIDMEWKFGVTSGSSELEKVGSIFLQLKLVVQKGNQTENLYIGYEMDLISERLGPNAITLPPSQDCCQGEQRNKGLILSTLYTQHGAQTHNPNQESHAPPTEPARHPVFSLS
ncbi:COMM domain-containing protein 7 isoform X3 [Callorhinus ursinus]|uniref:COMM domain-containing protein 7 isoform X3 n=1 Tax=Callorhinus ursinus TaxID=34884 RepID=UPI003CD021EE